METWRSNTACGVDAGAIKLNAARFASSIMSLSVRKHIQRRDGPLVHPQCLHNWVNLGWRPGGRQPCSVLRGVFPNATQSIPLPALRIVFTITHQLSPISYHQSPTSCHLSTISMVKSNQHQECLREQAGNRPGNSSGALRPTDLDVRKNDFETRFLFLFKPLRFLSFHRT